MRVVFHLGQHGGSATFLREPGDPAFYGLRHAAGEHRLFHYIRAWLNVRGWDVIKKRAQADGHLIGDEYQPYIRTRLPRPGVPHVMLWSGFYQLRGANEDWNAGKVMLRLAHDVFCRSQDTRAEIRRLCADRPEFETGPE